MELAIGNFELHVTRDKIEEDASRDDLKNYATEYEGHAPSSIFRGGY